MGKPQAKSRKPHKKGKGKTFKTKRRTLDADQRWTHIQPENQDKSLAEKTEFDEDKPGLGQFYCLSCDRYFTDSLTLDQHNSTKSHKRL